MTLAGKSLVELRGIAQAFGVKDIFQKDALQLRQAIEIKQQALIPEPKIEIPKPEYDSRLMTRPPSRKTDREEIVQLLAPYVARGLNLKFDEERWYMQFSKRTDEGTIRMPLKIVLRCAEKLLA